MAIGETEERLRFSNNSQSNYSEKSTIMSAQSVGEFEGEEKSGFARSFINLFRAFVGLGFLVLPHLVIRAGIVPFIVIGVTVTALACYGIDMINQVGEDIEYRGKSYEGICSKVLKSKFWDNAVKYITMLLQLSIAIANVLFVVDVLNFVTCQQGVGALCNRIPIITMIGFLISAPIVFIRNLTFFSNISIISLIVILTITISLAVWGWLHTTPASFAALPPAQPLSWPNTFAVFTFSLEGIGVLIPVKNSMKNQKDFRKLFISVSLFVAFIYIGYSVSAVIPIGSSILSVILYNFTGNSVYFFILAIVFSISVFLSYSINFFPVYTILLRTEFARRLLLHSKNRKKTYNNLVAATRIFCLVFVFGIVMFHPNLTAFLGFVGALFVSLLAFIMPVIVYNTHFGRKGELSAVRKYFNYFYLVVTLIISLIGAYTSFLQMIFPPPSSTAALLKHHIAHTHGAAAVPK